ncbi:MAG TPA: alpha-amylase family glycosyl hydrolase, partial [Fibrobacteraceae bacterium]|nr:alpha-amylase family glycosyl hydrolase [Fibrobacteraceae bacterium]
PRLWLEEAELDSVTGYEIYKSLWSSFNDSNFFEIAYSLKRLFDNQTGICKNKRLELFNENHDVSRIRSILKDPSDWYPLHFLFYMLPGIPSIYYGEEFGFQAIKGNQDDSNLRPSINSCPPEIIPEPYYLGVLEHLSGLRLSSPILIEGGYVELEVSPRRLAFKRTHASGELIVLINGEKNPTAFLINEKNPNAIWVDMTNPQENSYRVENGKIKVTVDANWGKVLKLQSSF